jgi:hypothetical protein
MAKLGYCNEVNVIDSVQDIGDLHRYPQAATIAIFPPDSDKLRC